MELRLSRRANRLPARALDPVWWVVALFVANFALQRISVPGISIPVTVPLTVIWLGLALLLGVLTLHPRRLLLWLVAAGVSALVVLLQLVFLPNPYVSVNSWAFWMVIWLPVVARLQDRSQAQYHRALRAVARVGVGLSTLTVLFLGSQFAGLRYRDWLAELLPSNLLVQGYAISYPVSYGSTIYKPNAWLALEPSFLSFTLGVCVASALLVRLSPLLVGYLLLGLLCTTAGSGVAIVGVFVLTLLLTGRLAGLGRYLLLGGVLSLAFALTSIGASLVNRATEVTTSNSSASLRAIEPYVFFWPRWIADPVGILLGRGPGSSQLLVENSGINGLLVPSVIKVGFDYGLVAGLLLLMVMVAAYLRSPAPALALALAVSMFTLQAAAQPLVLCTFLVVTFWSPATGRGGAGLDVPGLARDGQLPAGARDGREPAGLTVAGARR